MSNDIIVVDPRFSLPPNLSDVVYSGDVRDPDPTAMETDGTIDEIFDFTDGAQTIPQPPTSFSVITQTIHTAPDGTQVVDVVLDIPDQAGVSEYDIRVAKI